MGESLEICVPDIGDFDEVEVVELLVAKGDEVVFDDPLVSVVSDKATMEIPSTHTGVILELRVSEGDRVSEGSVLAVLELSGAAPVAEDLPHAPLASSASVGSAPLVGSTPVPAARVSPSPSQPVEPSAPALPVQAVVPAAEELSGSRGGQDFVPSVALSVMSAPPRRKLSREAAHPVPDRKGGAHASPLVRRYARELGVPVDSAKGSGPHGRLLLEDIKQHVRTRFAEDGSGGRSAVTSATPDGPQTSGVIIPPMPTVDYSVFGPVREEPLTRIQKVSGPVLHRSWLNIPHVTQYDESDVTELERFRRDRRALADERGVKLSPLLFVMKAAVRVLDEFPMFRSSLAPEADRLIVKDYFHLGIAVDTDQGLVVPVIRDVDRKGIFELAGEVNEMAERARNKKLRPDDLKGSCFTISSLGGIGGTGFSPIVNAPEVAILGLSKTRTQPVWRGPSPLDLPQGEPSSGSEQEFAGGFEPRLVMPFSLSYDHRVIDGASAVRFTTRLARVLSDPAQLLL